MAYTVTVQTLLTRVRQRSNLESAEAFITDDEITDNISQSYAEWYDMVRLTTFGGQMYRSTQTINTAPSTSAYALPSDFVTLISVDIYTSGSTTNQVNCARPYQEEMRNVYKWWNPGWAFNLPVFYQLQGSNISFIPTPPGTFQIGINYIPTATVLTTTDQTIDSVNGWEEWIVLDASIKCLIKAALPDMIAMLEPRLEQQADRIRHAAASRDQNGPERIHDVEGGGNFGGFNPWGE